MPLDDLIRVRHMIEACQEASFRRDRKTCRAVIQCIEVIGEAANGLSGAAREQMPDVPWHKIIGMRHRLIHAYFDINLSLVWEVVAKEMKPLLKALLAYPL